MLSLLPLILARERGLEPLNLQWLGGYALVSETRRVRLPAGESELRFEGVTADSVVKEDRSDWSIEKRLMS